MKKRLLLLTALLIAVSMCLSSCALIFKTRTVTYETARLHADDDETEETTELTETTEADSPTPADDGVVRGDGIYTYCYTEANKTELSDDISALESALKAGDDANAFKEQYDAFEKGSYALMMTNYKIAESDSYLYYNDAEIQRRFLDMSKIYNDTTQSVLLLYKAIYNSDFSDVFFADWTEDDVRVALKLADGYTDEFSALRVEYDNIKSEFNDIQSSENFISESAKLYMDAVKVNKRMAQIMGYDNYMDFAFDVYYERDYTPEDAKTVSAYVKEYIVPMLSETINELSTAASKIKPTEYVLINNCLNGTVNNKTEKEVSDLLTGYLSAMGGDILEEYNKMFSDGNYIFANNDTVSRGVAFSQYMDATDSPMCYFGPGYQGIYHFIHEFGHYYSFVKAEDKEFPIDLAEVHSQGNEWLYTAYLQNVVSRSAYQYVAYASLADNLFSLINCLTVYEFEMYVYTHDDYTADDLDGIMKNVMDAFGVYEIFSLYMSEPTSYWHYVTIENPGYYVSYSVSLVPSLELYALALDDFGGAAQKYMSLTAIAAGDTFIGKLESAGIYSPFSEDAYNLITSIPDILGRGYQDSAA